MKWLFKRSAFQNWFAIYLILLVTDDWWDNDRYQAYHNAALGIFGSVVIVAAVFRFTDRWGERHPDPEEVNL